jgi:hypothetical protein
MANATPLFNIIVMTAQKEEVKPARSASRETWQVIDQNTTIHATVTR